MHAWQCSTTYLVFHFAFTSGNISWTYSVTEASEVRYCQPCLTQLTHLATYITVSYFEWASLCVIATSTTQSWYDLLNSHYVTCSYLLIAWLLMLVRYRLVGVVKTLTKLFVYSSLKLKTFQHNVTTVLPNVFEQDRCNTIDTTPNFIYSNTKQHLIKGGE